LLAFLAPEREAAGEKYESLRRKLVIFFANRHCAGADELADRVMDLLATKAERGLRLPPEKVPLYAYRVARFVVLQAHRKPPVYPLGGDPPRAAWPAPSGLVEEADFEDLESCLGVLPLASRETILRFYRAQGRKKIDDHVRMAEELGISGNALRIRMFQIREKLRRCLEQRRAARDEMFPFAARQQDGNARQ
jgi:DNA-directed RNA polymerase specialized sigma24 family protein